jgi:hypothetical protein
MPDCAIDPVERTLKIVLRLLRASGVNQFHILTGRAGDAAELFTDIAISAGRHHASVPICLFPHHHGSLGTRQFHELGREFFDALGCGFDFV